MRARAFRWRVLLARRASVLVFVVAVLGLFVWAGVHNMRARRAAVHDAHITITKDEGSMPLDDSGAPASQGRALKGKAAPGFKLVDTAGKRVSLEEYKGHAVVVNFWAVYCGPCKQEMPWLQELANKYSDKGLVILGIDSDEDKSAPEVATSATHLGVKYPILMGDSAVDKAYGGIDFLPQTFYVDKAGKVVETTAGGRPKDEIEADIQKALAAGGL